MPFWDDGIQAHDFDPFAEGHIAGPPRRQSNKAIGEPVDERNFMYPGAERDPATGNLVYGFDVYNQDTRDIAAGYGGQLSGMGGGLYNYGGRIAGMGEGALGADPNRLIYDPTLDATRGSIGTVDQAGATLMGIANGPGGPSAAEALLRAGTADAQRQSLALATSGRGLGGGAAARRAAMAQNAEIAGRMNPELAALRAREADAERAARIQAASAAAGAGATSGQLNLGMGGYVTGARGQGEQLATERGLGLINQGIGAAGAGGTMVGQGGQLELTGQQLVGGANQAQLNAQVAHEEIKAGRRAQDRALQGQEMQAEAQNKAGIIGLVGQMGSSVATMAGPAAAASDVRAKKDIVPLDEKRQLFADLDAAERAGTDFGATSRYPSREDLERAPQSLAQSFADEVGGDGWVFGPSDTEAREAVREAPGYAFRYKNPERHGEGQRVGVMAQDLEKTPAGRRAVFRSPDGTRMLEQRELGGLAMAGLHDQEQRVTDLEEELRKTREALGYPTPRGVDTDALDAAAERERGFRY